MKIVSSLAVAIGLSLMTVGCAIMNTVKEMPASVDQKVKALVPPPGQALVYIVRPTMLGKPFGGNVAANGIYIGTTQGGLYVYAVLPPGPYKFTVTGHDNSPELQATLAADTTYYIYQSDFSWLVQRGHEA